MKNSKKIMLIIAFIVVVVLLSGGLFLNNYLKSVRDYQAAVKNITIADIDMSKIPDGVYTGDCDVDFIYANVEVKVEKGAIMSIEILEHRNDRSQLAERIVDRVIEEQTVDVDVISTATNSSKVIKKAIENALLSGDY